jgi:hypothetical protein
MTAAAEVASLIVDRGSVGVFGDEDAQASRIVVGWSATADLLARLGEPTIVVCRAHPFFRSPSLFSPDEFFGLEDWPARSAHDRLIPAKRELLDRSGSTIVWAPRWWDVDGPATRSRAMAEAAGLDARPARAADQALVADIDPGDLAVVVDRLLPAWGATRALMTGTTSRRIRRIGLIAGVASPAQLGGVLEEDVDAIVVGETIEWEGTPFMQDRQTAGVDVPLVAVGTLQSEQPASAVVAERIRAAGLGARVDVETVADAAWTPEGAA